jgi:hypothetical protein
LGSMRHCNFGSDRLVTAAHKRQRWLQSLQLRHFGVSVGKAGARAEAAFFGEHSETL